MPRSGADKSKEAEREGRKHRRTLTSDVDHAVGHNTVGASVEHSRAVPDARKPMTSIRYLTIRRRHVNEKEHRAKQPREFVYPIFGRDLAKRCGFRGILLAS